MLAIRIVGALVAVVLLATSVPRYRRRQISRLNLIISWALAVGIILLAIAPEIFNPIFDLFNFRPGNNRRLTAVLLFGVIVEFILLFRIQSYTDVNERSIRLLVEALGVQAFDWQRTE